MAHDAYATFGHPAVTPLVQIDRNTLDSGAVSRPDARLQGRGDAAARALMDYVLAKRGQRATIVGATSGDTGGAAIEAFRRSRASTW